MSGPSLEEALGPEGEGLGVDVGAGVGEPDRRGHVGPGRQRRGRRRSASLGEAPAGERDHRPQPQRLGDRRPQVLVLALPRASRAGARIGAGWRSSRSKVQARAVAVVSWPASSRVISWSRSSASLIPSPSSKRASDQQREDVVALLEVAGRRGARRSRRRAARRLPRSWRSNLRRTGRAPPKRLRGEADQLRGGERGLRQRPRSSMPAQPLQPRPVGDAEDDAQDHLERHRLHARVDRRTPRPAARSRSRASTISSTIGS